MNVLDEHGTRWRVSSGDPALKAVHALEQRGFGLVVLPREVLTSGVVSGTLEVPLHDLDDAEFVRSVRLNECLAALQGV